MQLVAAKYATPGSHPFAGCARARQADELVGRMQRCAQAFGALVELSKLHQSRMGLLGQVQGAAAAAPWLPCYTSLAKPLLLLNIV